LSAPARVAYSDTAKHPKRPRYPNQLAKLILDMTTGERPNGSPKGLESPATAVRRKGGLKGGAARAKKLPAKEQTAKADHVWGLEQMVTLAE
jgi:hypothetical protein